jgi:hypothetical protein
MYLIAPDLLADAVGLSGMVSGAGLIVGFLLWLLGCWGQRFWIVLIATVAAGIYGLQAGPAVQLQPVVVGLLLALAAGMLALALVRVVAFTAGGIVTWLAVRALVPAWDEPLLCFLVGGLVGLLLFKFLTMALTSLAGTLLMAYSSLCLAHGLGRINAVGWAESHALLLDWACAGVAFFGLVVQFLLDRWQLRHERLLEMRATGQLPEGEMDLFLGRWRWFWLWRRWHRRVA